MEATEKPNNTNAQYKAMSDAIKIVRDVAGGTPSMRNAGTTYLPQEPAETDAAYKRRKERSVLFNAYLRTRGALTGMVFKKDPTIAEDVPEIIRQHLENVDMAGTHFDVFAKEIFENAFEGHAFVFVDMQKALPSGATLADEKAVGLRPYWVKYRVDQAVNWRTARINGEQKIVQITFCETSSEPSGKYGEAEVTRYRVLMLVDGVVTWELWRHDKGQSKEEDQFIIEDSGTIKGFSEIPVSVVYGRKKGLCYSEPPLLDLAYLNIRHWQNYSDYSNILHVAQVPILHRKGATTEQQAVEIGVGSTVDTPTEGDLKWVEIQGNGITASQKELADLEQRMAVMGLSILADKNTVETTATQSRQDYQERQSDLATMARSLKDCLEQALKFHAQYLGLDLKANDGGSIELGVEEMALTLTPQHLTVLLTAVQSNKLSLETFLTVLLNLLEQSDLLPDDLEVKDEMLKIEEARKTQEAMGLPALVGKGGKIAPKPVQDLLGAQGA